MGRRSERARIKVGHIRDSRTSQVVLKSGGNAEVSDEEESVAKTDSEEEEEDDEDVAFRVGDEVACQLNGDWYSGFIGVVNENGTADINFEDGDFEPGVPLENIKLLSEVSVSEPSSSDDESEDEEDEEAQEQGVDYGIPTGTKVAVRYHGGDSIYAGKISEIHEDGTFTIKYDDGEIETNVPPENISVIEEAEKSAPSKFKVGSEVICRYQGSEDYYEGAIVKVRAGNRYDVKYSDNEVEENIPEKDIQLA